MSVDDMSPRKLEPWKQARGEMLGRIEQLRRQGVCYVCHDLQTGEVFQDRCLIYEDHEFRIVLDPYPRVEGQTIIVYKPHRDDISELFEEEAGVVMQMVVRVVKAIQKALGAEKVYVLSMCDGPVSHLNFQLLPRYPGNLIGYRRLAAERRPLEEGQETAALVRAAMDRPDTTRKTIEPPDVPGWADADITDFELG